MTARTALSWSIASLDTVIADVWSMPGIPLMTVVCTGTEATATVS
ncbi:hypothetical protein SBI_00308 [Streptomyces bingchenggensis BCW-1]|uniref:Uncharacterized protein n=1 Tax=Streptomyces bingchenggensis (strain BCW-1) TaxID=749414 RepID=D7BWS3_STRBB|nr:hypothetical protein SBI_00308 [Streptomyces bingchenggensis BCW-1]